MKAKIRCRSRQEFLTDQLHLLGVAEGKEQSIIMSIGAVGVELSVDEAFGLGLSPEDLRAAVKESQEFEVRLVRKG